MKTVLLSLISSFVLSFTLFTQTSLLEIHHIGAGDGDATLIIAIDETNSDGMGDPVWDTCVVLIDGQRAKEGEEVWRYVHDTISEHFPNRLKIDHIVVSHLHIDHYGGLTKLIDNAKKEGWEITDVITRQALVRESITNFGKEIDSCYADINLQPPSGAKKLEFFNILKKYGIRQPAYQVGDDLFEKNNFINIYMECIVAAGVTRNTDKANDLIIFLKSNNNGTYTAKSENDLSYGWLLSFQGFHYTTFGDLGGDGEKKRYADGETPVTNYLTGHFNNEHYHLCSHKVSHHGSAESTSADFAKANNIFIAVITASLKAYGSSKNPLPTQAAITNLSKNPDTTDILFTFVPQNAGDLSSYWTYNNNAYYKDVILKIIGLPGKPDYGENLPIQIIERMKNIDDFQYVDEAVCRTGFCTKGHNW